MDILLWVVFGLVVGIVAKLIMPGADPGGIVVTIVLGIVGALLGGWIGRVMGLYFLNRGLAPLGSLLAGALAAVLGAPRTVEVMGLSCALIVLWVWFAAPEVRELQY